MGVVLPDEAAWVLDLIGISWPNVDEDDYRDMADGLRSFASQVRGGRDATDGVVRQFIEGNEGLATAVNELQTGGPDAWRNLRMLDRTTNFEIGTQQIRRQIPDLPDGTPIRIDVKWWPDD
jgi:hypothetical protein